MMEGAPVMRNIDRMSSIESEPRTLKMDQIHFAREAALHVLQTRSMEEAMRIFTEGLKPVMSVVGKKAGTLDMDISSGEFDHDFTEEDRHHFESRDVVTAPF